MIEFTLGKVLGASGFSIGQRCFIVRRCSRSLFEEFYAGEWSVVATWVPKDTHLWLEETTLRFLDEIGEAVQGDPNQPNTQIDPTEAVFLRTYPRPVSERGITFAGFWHGQSFMVDVMDIDESEAYLEQQGAPFPGT